MSYYGYQMESCRASIHVCNGPFGVEVKPIDYFPKKHVSKPKIQYIIFSVQFSRSVMSDSLRPHDTLRETNCIETHFHQQYILKAFLYDNICFG